MNKTDKVDLARRLLRELESGNDAGANDLLGELNAQYESSLFHEIGKLTRELHDALARVQVDSRLAGLAENEMPDARHRLDYVITKTEEAAHKTLTAVEELMPLSTDIRTAAQEMQADWQRFTRREMSVEEFRELSERVGRFLADIDNTAERIHSGLGDVLMAQDYQDLTGQVIRRIMVMVQEVEDGLIGLIRRTSQLDLPAGAGTGTGRTEDKTARGIRAEGPQILAHETAVALVDQDEVDELLSNLGF